MRYRFTDKKTLKKLITAKRKYKLRLYKQHYEQKPQQHYYITVSPIDENVILLSKSRNALIDYVKTAFKLMGIKTNNNYNDIIKKIGEHDLMFLNFTDKTIDYLPSAYDFNTQQIVFNYLAQKNGVYNDLKDCINAIIHDSRKYTKKPKVTHIDLNTLKLILNGGNIIYQIFEHDGKYTFKLIHLNK